MMQASLQLVKAEFERLSLQQKLLQANENAELQAGNDIKKLDASVKKNTALIKKLRNITEDNVSSLLDDIARTNQSKVRHMAAIHAIGSMAASWAADPLNHRSSSCLVYYFRGNVCCMLHGSLMHIKK